MAFAQDVLTRIVNVNFPSGGVFVYGNDDGEIYMRSSGSPGWEQARKFIDEAAGWGYSFVGSSYGLVNGENPVFVMAGYGGGALGTGAICASHDGRTWTKVFSLLKEEPDRNTSATIFAVVWDEKDQAFYAAAHQSLNRIEGDNKLYEIDILLKSADGFSWAETERFKFMTADGDDPSYVAPEYTKGLLVKHCSDKVVDGLGNGLPDGFYKYDPSSEILIRPENVPNIDYFFGGIGGVAAGGVVSEGIDVPVGSPDFPTLCVAGVGGSWVAGGGTYEEGKSASLVIGPDSAEWEQIGTSGRAVITMVGGRVNAGL